MDPQAFAAQRRARLGAADEQLTPYVRESLIRYGRGEADWMDAAIDEAAQVWLENFTAESPGRPYQRPLARFRTALEDTLALTDQPDDFPDPGQVRRITSWLSTYAVNAGTTAGAFGRGIRFKRWTTMADADVREIHRPLEGQVVPIGSTFSVDGVKLAYPGDPQGPPEIWINCRCVIMPAARDGETMSATTYTIGPDDPIEIDNPDIIPSDDQVAVLAAAVADPTDIAVEPVDEEDLVDDDPEDGEELITEIPVHGVLAPEGVPTGDGRLFALEALRTRDLPVPLRYEFESSHGGDNSRVATIGRVDEAWRDDASNMWRWRGAVVLTKPYAQEAIDGMVDGTVRGVSIDGDDAVVDVTPSPAPRDGAGEEEPDLLSMLLNPEDTVYSQMRVAGLTIVPIPAFQEAYIALGPDFQEDLSAADQATQLAALQACGCLDGWAELDLTDTALDDARAAIAAELATARDGHTGFDHDVDVMVQSLTDAMGVATGDSTTSTSWPAGAATSAVSHDTFAPGTHDGPGWITHPVPTARIRRYWTRGKGAAKIRWGQSGDFNRCRAQLAKYVQNPDWLAGLCANMHHEALGFWPAQHHGARVIVAAGSALAAPAARLAPAEQTVFPRVWFDNPGLDRAVPLRIEPDSRRVYGYLAEWGSCHVGVEGMCQDVPRSHSDYAYFKKGVVDTDAGEQPVGVISYGTGHADRFARVAAATAHYDQPTAVRAYVNIGEDEFGIWFAGVLAAWVTEEDITAMRAIGATSGDWREIRGQLELIGVPVVNTPGFPLRALVASGGRQITMIGAGALTPEPPDATVAATLTLTDEMVDDIAHRAVAQLRRQQAVAERAVPAREAIRRQRLAAARAQLERI